MGERTERARDRVNAARAVGEQRLARAQQSMPSVAAGMHWFERERLSGAALLAGGLAYRFFFWLTSFGLVLAAIGSFWARDDSESLEKTAKSAGLGGVAAHSAASALKNGSHGRWYFLIAGVVLMAWFGFGAVKALRVAGFIAWRLKPTKPKSLGKASAVFSGFAGVGLTAGAVLPALGDVGVLGLVALYTIAFAVFALFFAAAFSLLPRVKDAGLEGVVPGAMLCAAGVVAIHVFVNRYLAGKLERSPNLYGALGAATVVLVWLFIMGRVVVAGMFLNSTLWFRKIGAEPPSPSRSPTVAPGPDASEAPHSVA